MTLINIRWKEHPISKEEEAALRPVLITKGYYGEIYPALKGQIQETLRTIRKKLKSKITYNQAVAIRRVMLRDKFIRRSYKLVHLKTIIRVMYTDEKKDILTIAKKLDYPPVTIFRTLLMARGMTKNQIKRIVGDPDNYLGKRDLEQLRKAIAQDIISDPDNQPRLEAALEFERELEAKFIKKKIYFKTQKQLAAEQKKSLGRAILTPDLYFPHGVKINGHIIYWMDAKNFYGGNSSYIRSGIQKQGDKYNHAYGPGAFVFKYGYSDHLKSDAMLLAF